MCYQIDCLVQMSTDEIDGGRRFFICPRAWVFLINVHIRNMFLVFTNTYARFWLQSSMAEDNCGFTRWVDPPIYPHQQHIYYLQGRVFEQEREVRSMTRDEEEDDNDNGAGSQEAVCTDPYCNYPCHKKNGPPPPPPPPPTM